MKDKTTNRTIKNAAKKDVPKSLTPKQLTTMALIAALICVCAKISFPLPFFPVPFTMQTFAVLVCALMLSPKQSFYTLAVYIFLGLTGLPVFAQGGGPSYALSPTFGYIAGFLIAAPMISALKEKIWPMAACALGILALHALGIAYFSFVSSFIMHAPLKPQAMIYMAYIYLPLDAVKIVAAHFACSKLKLTRRLII